MEPRAVDVVLVGTGLASPLVDCLRQEGLVVEAEPCDADRDAVLLIGGPDGSRICRDRRAAEPSRRIVVLAEPGGAVAALEAGADDVVLREGLSWRELVLRLRAVRRRGGAVVEAGEPEPVRIGPLVIGPEPGRVQVDGQPCSLPPTEYRVLRVLAQRSDKVIGRRTLMGLAWGVDDLDDRTVDSIVKRLRVRLGAAGELIETVRGVGYRLSARALTP